MVWYDLMICFYRWIDNGRWKIPQNATLNLIFDVFLVDKRWTDWASFHFWTKLITESYDDYGLAPFSVLQWPRSKKIFHNFISGQFGQSLVDMFVRRLDEFQHLGADDIRSEYFSLSLEAMGEHWRRFSFPTNGFPFAFFRLLDFETDDAAFLNAYFQIQEMARACGQCADLEFSTVILSFIDHGSQMGDPGTRSKIHQLRRFLNSIAIYGPLSTDLVECAHGFMQCLLHTWRGSKPTDDVAVERVLWSTITRQYSKFREWIWDRFFDKPFRHRIGRYGMTSNNQYRRQGADADVKFRPRKKAGRGFSFEKMDRMLAFDQELPKLRKLCGYLAT